jgi:hypothetical protein
MSMHFVMQIRAGGRHVLSTHLTYHAHTITEMQLGKPAGHTHTHTHTQLARDSYVSNRLFTYFATLQQLSTVNDTLKRAIHGGSSFLSTHVTAREPSDGVFAKFNDGELPRKTDAPVLTAKI